MILFLSRHNVTVQRNGLDKDSTVDAQSEPRIWISALTESFEITWFRRYGPVISSPTNFSYFSSRSLSVSCYEIHKINWGSSTFFAHFIDMRRKMHVARGPYLLKISYFKWDCLGVPVLCDSYYWQPMKKFLIYNEQLGHLHSPNCLTDLLFLLVNCQLRLDNNIDKPQLISGPK